MSNFLTTGMRSSEFLMTVVVLLIGLSLVITEHLDVSVYWPFAAAAASAYSVSRGLAKNELIIPKITE